MQGSRQQPKLLILKVGTERAVKRTDSRRAPSARGRERWDNGLAFQRRRASATCPRTSDSQALAAAAREAVRPGSGRTSTAAPWKHLLGSGSRAPEGGRRRRGIRERHRPGPGSRRSGFRHRAWVDLGSRSVRQAAPAGDLRARSVVDPLARHLDLRGNLSQLVMTDQRSAPCRPPAAGMPQPPTAHRPPPDASRAPRRAAR